MGSLQRSLIPGDHLRKWCLVCCSSGAGMDRVAADRENSPSMQVSSVACFCSTAVRVCMYKPVALALQARKLCTSSGAPASSAARSWTSSLCAALLAASLPARRPRLPAHVLQSVLRPGGSWRLSTAYHVVACSSCMASLSLRCHPACLHCTCAACTASYCRTIGNAPTSILAPLLVSCTMRHWLP